MDDYGDEVKAYNPRALTHATREIRLKENQELIGVYGVYGTRGAGFESFGFIVKVNKTS